MAEDYILACACSQKKVIPNVLADSEDQQKSVISCIQFYYFLRIRNTVVYMLLRFKPDIDLKVSNILMGSLNNLKEPSSANVASSANSVLLISFLPTNHASPVEKLISGFFRMPKKVGAIDSL